MARFMTRGQTDAGRQDNGENVLGPLKKLPHLFMLLSGQKERILYLLGPWIGHSTLQPVFLSLDCILG